MISEDVLTDVSEIIDWYDSISEKVSKKFNYDFVSRLESVSNHPFKYQIRYSKYVRIAPLKGFPYGIHYYIRLNTIYIIAIFHYKISPKHWRKRS